jgi:hypothetical protein
MKEVPSTLKILLKQRVPQLDVSAVRSGVCADPPIKRIPRELAKIQEAGPRPYESSLFD